MVAHQLVSGRTIRLFGDELISRRVPPFGVGRDALFVAYYASAELNCFLQLNWPLPVNVLDLFAEFRTRTNGDNLPCGSGLLGALIYYGLPASGAEEKEDMRRLAMRGGPFTPDEAAALIDYCGADVGALRRLFDVMARRMTPLNLQHGLLRGEWMKCAAQIEHAGIPIDVEALNLINEHLEDIQDDLIQSIDKRYHVFDGRTFKRDRFKQFLIRNRIPWPVTETGEPSLDDDTFANQAKIRPGLIAPLHELRKTLSQLRGHKLAIGPDCRNRCMLSAFRAKTSRNQPSNSKFIFGFSKWMRGLIRAKPGKCIGCIDWAQQEWGIAAAFSRDTAAIEAYNSGDPYMRFAVQAGAAPPDATKKTHKAIRDIYKICALGVLYSMGPGTLSDNTGLYLPYAKDLLARHRKTYPEFWKWSERVLNQALLHNELHTVFGWNLFVGGDPNPNSLRNFPMQANGAEMLRLAIMFAIQRGIKVIAPVHDAIMIEADDRDLMDAIFETKRAMCDASRKVLGGMELRTEVKPFRYPLRYVEDEGVVMWRTVWRIIRGVRG